MCKIICIIFFNYDYRRLNNNIKLDLDGIYHDNYSHKIPLKKYYSIKVVSASLNNNEYNKFNYKKTLEEIIKVIDRII